MNGLPPPPPGFVLEPQSAMPPPPPGFVLEGQAPPNTVPGAQRPGIDTALNPDGTIAPGQQTNAPGASDAAKALTLGLQGPGRGIADLLGAPVDLTAAAMNLGLGAADMLSGGSVPLRITNPIGGSESIAGAASAGAEALGVPIQDPNTLPFDQRAMYEATRFGTSALAGSGALAARAPALAAGLEAGTAKPSMLNEMTKPYVGGPGVAPFVRDAAAGAGTGTAIAANEEFVKPGLPEWAQPLSDILAGLVGAIGGGGLGVAATEGPRAVADRVASYAGSAARPKDIPYDPNGEMVTRRQFDSIKGYLQENATRDPQANVDAMRSAKAEINAGGYTEPSMGLLTGDPGLVAAERFARGQNPTPFRVRDAQVQNSVSEGVTAIAPPIQNEAERRAIGTLAAGEANAQRGGALAQQRQAGQNLSEAEAASAARLQTAQGAADERVAQTQTLADQQLADAERQRLAAEQQGQQIAAPVEALRGTEGQASTALDRTLNEGALQPRTQAKNAAFEAVDPTRSAMTDATPLQDRVNTIRSQIGALTPEQRAQIPAEFLQRIEALAPRTETRTTTTLPADGTLKSVKTPGVRQETVDAGGTGQVALGDLIEVRKYLNTTAEKAQAAGNFDLANNVRSLKGDINRMIDASPDAAGAQQYYREQYAPFFAEGTGRTYRDKVQKDFAGTRKPSETADMFLYTGSQEAAADVRRIISIADNPAQGEAAVRNYLAAKAANTIGADGQFSANALKNFIANNRGTLDQFPAIRQEFDGLLAEAVNARGRQAQAADAVRTTASQGKATVATAKSQGRADIAATQESLRQRVEQYRANLKAADQNVADTERRIGNGILATLIDKDPLNAAAEVFGSGDPARRMAEIVALARKDPAALRSWKAAVTEHLTNRITNTNTAVTGGENAPVSVAKLTNFLKQNERALAEVYEPSEMLTLKRGLRAIEPYGNLSVTPTAGSPTMQNNVAAQNALETILRLKYGLLKGGGMMAVFKRTMNTLKGDTAREDVDLLTRVLLDPDLTEMMLLAPPAKVATPAWNAQLQKALRYGAAAREVNDQPATEPEEEPK